MRGLEGSDDLLRRGGADELYGGRANDRVRGHGGDVLRGDDGVDILDRGRGPDTLYARSDGPSDEVYCGDGVDRVDASPEDSVADDCETVEPVGNP